MIQQDIIYKKQINMKTSFTSMLAMFGKNVRQLGILAALLLGQYSVYAQCGVVNFTAIPTERDCTNSNIVTAAAPGVATCVNAWAVLHQGVAVVQEPITLSASGVHTFTNVTVDK